MDADEIRAMYRDMCQMPFKIRRGATDYAVIGYARLAGGAELAGTVTQSDMTVIVLAEALEAADFPLPLVSTDKHVMDRERRMLAPPGERKALDGTLIAYEFQARG